MEGRHGGARVTTISQKFQFTSQLPVNFSLISQDLTWLLKARHFLYILNCLRGRILGYQSGPELSGRNVNLPGLALCSDVTELEVRLLHVLDWTTFSLRFRCYVITWVMISYVMDDPNTLSIDIMCMPVYLDFMPGQTQMLMPYFSAVDWNIAP